MASDDELDVSVFIGVHRRLNSLSLQIFVSATQGEIVSVVGGEAGIRSNSLIFPINPLMIILPWELSHGPIIGHHVCGHSRRPAGRRRFQRCRRATGGIPLHGIVPGKTLSLKIAFSPNLLGGSEV